VRLREWASVYFKWHKEKLMWHKWRHIVSFRWWRHLCSTLTPQLQHVTFAAVLGRIWAGKKARLQTSLRFFVRLWGYLGSKFFH
jgi:hypothetical protein